MVAIIKTGASIRSTFYYNENKLKEGVAECIMAGNYPKTYSFRGISCISTRSRNYKFDFFWLALSPIVHFVVIILRNNAHQLSHQNPGLSLKLIPVGVTLR